MILMNDFPRQWDDTRADVLAAVCAVGESGWYITGSELASFERALAQVWGVPHAAGVASGLDALEIALRVSGCKAGDFVLTTPLSAFATTLAILKIGATPVFVDTDEFGLIDLDLCAEVLAARSEIRFLIPVHLYGHALDLTKLEQLPVTIVEDCAQSILAKHAGRSTGTAGSIAATSFYPTKNLGAMGDGGAILTNDEALCRQVKSLRDYGQSAKYRHDAIGYNSRLDELHAAILRIWLARLPGWTARRRAIAQEYLAGISHPGVRPVGMPAGSDSSFHLFPVLCSNKQSLMDHLKRRGIMTGEHYPILIPDQKALAFPSSHLPNARRFAEQEVSLPIHPYLNDDEVGCVVEAVNEWS